MIIVFAVALRLPGVAPPVGLLLAAGLLLAVTHQLSPYVSGGYGCARGDPQLALGGFRWQCCCLPLGGQLFIAAS